MLKHRLIFRIQCVVFLFLVCNISYGTPHERNAKGKSSMLSACDMPVREVVWKKYNDVFPLTNYVDPMIGTGGHGHVFLGANVPFGFVQLGPTQPIRGWDWCSGYHYSDSVIIGFSHTHLSGTGIGDLGDVALLPASSTLQRQIKFSHDNEQAYPGYYVLNLNEPKVTVELTATERVGFHRYTFRDANTPAYVMLNLAQGIGWDKMTECALKQESPTTVTGYRFSKGWAKDQRIYFVAEFSVPVTLHSQFADSLAIFAVDTHSPVLVKVALSPVSVSNARENMTEELSHWNFEQTVHNARALWEKQLEKICVTTNDQSLKRIFYTAMYHTMIAPSVYGDVNGDYRGADGLVHHADFTPYTTLSLWDTYRAAHPLMTLIHPERQADIARTFIDIFKRQGKLPVWHLMNNETDCMVGNPAIPVLADLVLKGFVQDKEAAYEAMKHSALLDERGLGLLKQYGYLPCDEGSEHETVAKGLEYALADAGVAKVAHLLGKKKDFRYFYNRSMAYKHYFDRQTGFMRGKTMKGTFREPFDPFRAVHRQDDYTEGNAWQYIWLVPHDVHGLVKCFGNEKAFANKLDSLFVAEGDMGSEASPDITGLIGQYAHGNEPSHHILYLYNYIGQPWKSVPLLRRTMRELYTDAIDGLSGNEDVGQMSAWYILSSMGIYQVEPSGGKFVLGSPLFDDIVMKVGEGKTFHMKVRRNNEDDIYIHSAFLNGQPYTKSYILFDDIIRGGILELNMSSNPSRYGISKKDRP